MFVLLRALFSPLRWLDATWLLRSCCRVERERERESVFNVRIPANVAQIKFKLEGERSRRYAPPLPFYVPIQLAARLQGEKWKKPRYFETAQSELWNSTFKMEGFLFGFSQSKLTPYKANEHGLMSVV
ncbi:uncharacterized protein LOC144289109 [Canis aureus]